MSKPCALNMFQCIIHGCVQTRTGLNRYACERYVGTMNTLDITDVKFRLDRRLKIAHFWDGNNWYNYNEKTSPVALCGELLFPRDPSFFVSEEEMRTIPVCKKCLPLIKR